MPCTILKEQILEGSFCEMTSGWCWSVDGGRPTVGASCLCRQIWM